MTAVDPPRQGHRGSCLASPVLLLAWPEVSAPDAGADGGRQVSSVKPGAMAALFLGANILAFGVKVLLQQRRERR